MYTSDFPDIGELFCLMNEDIAIPEILRPLISNLHQDSYRQGTSDTRLSIGHLKLSYAAQRLFNIRRFPTHPERYTRDWWHGASEFEAIIDILEHTSEAEWEKTCEALRHVHEQLVDCLKKDYPDGKVMLKRRLRPATTTMNQYADSYAQDTYAGMLCVAALKARHEGISDICFETDILSGWCLHDPGGYGRILLRKEFSINDVLMAAPYMGNRDLEVDEWLVLNRNPSGLLTMSVSDIQISPELEENYLERARSYSWQTISSYHRQNLKGRVSNYPLPSHNGCKYDPPWYVKLAHRIDQVQKIRALNKRKKNKVT